MRQFVVYFLLRKGIGPDYTPHTVFVGLDDIDPEATECDIKQLAKEEAERELKNSMDYFLYGKTWIYQEIEEA